MRKKQQHMKTLQFKKKRMKIKTKEFNKFGNQLKHRWTSFDKCSKEGNSGLLFSKTLPPCPKHFSTDKSATVEADSPTIILKAEGAKVHWRCLLANWWPIWTGSTKTKPVELETSTTVAQATTKRTSSMPNTTELSLELFMSSRQSMWSTPDPRVHMPR